MITTLEKNGQQVDASAVINYRTGRRIEYRPAQIGDHAHIRSGTVIYSNVRIGRCLETGHNVVIREENEIGENFHIWNNSVIDYGCVIGNNVRIHCNVYVAQFTVIEDDVFLAPGVTVANDLHPICTQRMFGPTIKRRARIGCNATLLPRIVIGESVLVGAGSVVTEDVPDRMVVVGNPARIICAIEDLRCQSGLIERPYVDGLDVVAQEALASMGISINGCGSEDGHGGVR